MWAPRLALLLIALLAGALSIGCGGAGGATGASTPRPSASAGTSSTPSAALAPMPVISRNAPAYAVGAIYPATKGNDGTYGPGGAAFDGTPPTSLVYDLSKAPAAQRQTVLATWYNDETAWDAAAISTHYYNEPRDYTVDASGADGDQPPGDGDASWKTLVKVAGNIYNGREHVLDLHGARWIRMRVTAVNGSVDNMGASFNLDVQDASHGIGDTWLFLGDSITEDGMAHYEPDNFMQQVNAAKPPFFPSQLNGGLGGWASASVLANDPATGQQYLSEFLAVFPGRFVSLAYGTNDANLNVDPATYRTNVETMVKAVIAAGKGPVVPLIPWGCTPGIQANGPKLNQQIQDLWAAYPQIVHGADQWSYFQGHHELIGADCIHPIVPQGAAAFREQNAKAMLATVYKA